VSFVNDTQPGVVESHFTDVDGRNHRIIDKVPIFTTSWLGKTSRYPQPGVVRCELLAEWRDPLGRQLRRITTSRPDNVESVEGLSEFVVLAEQVS
jgi:hypothetical protein